MALSLHWQRFHAPLRFRFKHASASRATASSIIVKLSDGQNHGFGEACPRPYVTGETEQSVIDFLESRGEQWAASVRSLDDLRTLLETEGRTIDENPAAFGALELACLSLLAQRAQQSLEALLAVPPLDQDLQYSAVVGDSGPGTTALQSWIYALAGFRDFKIKLGTDLPRDIQRFSRLPPNIRLRVDANNLYEHPQDFIAHLTALKKPIWAVEEPLRPGDAEGQAHIARQTGVRIILDESLFNQDQLTAYADPSLGWIANIRVSKSGGVLRSIDLARSAQQQGMDVILGAHVGESSLLSRAALTVGQALDTPLLAREGAFGRILVTEDVARPSLRFGRGGRLRLKPWGFADRAGLGLSMAPNGQGRKA